MRSTARHWGDVRTRSIWRWQLILAATTVTVLGTIALLDPALFTAPTFAAGSIAVPALTAATLLIPWHRVPGPAVALLPLADIVAIALLAAGGQSRAALLWLFPVAWLATYYAAPWLVAGLALVAGFLAIDVFAGGQTPQLVQRAVIVLLCLGFMGVIVHSGERRSRAFAKLLRRQFDQLDRTRRRAEEQSRRTALLADSLETGIARIDRDGVLLDANLAFLRLYGAASLAEFTPTGAVEYDDHRGIPVAPHDTLVARAAAGERWGDRRVWLFDAHARWRALDLTTRPIDGDSEMPESNLVIVREVTEAVAAERERATVSTVVSHELRNPLTAILGHTDLLLERSDLPPDIARQLAVIEHAGQRMERLVTSVLHAESADSAFAPVDVRAVVEASLLAFAPTATSAQVLLAHALGPSGEVWGDAFRLRQAIDNVIGNAVKYTTRGGTVHVETVETEVDGRIFVEVAVADTGIGMSDPDRERIFERGFRSDAARSSGISGNGIGMAVVAEIVEQHGGVLEVRSTLGRGTRVALRLPLPAAPGLTTADAGGADERMPS